MPDPTYEAKYGKGPHLAVDAVIINAEDEIAIIRREDNDRLGLPGGFAEPTETLLDTARQEVWEEIGLDLRWIEPYQLKIFDAVDRDPRSRIVSIAFYFRIPNNPKLNAGGDAVDAGWMPTAEALASHSRLYADHKEIIAAI